MEAALCRCPTIGAQNQYDRSLVWFRDSLDCDFPLGWKTVPAATWQLLPQEVKTGTRITFKDQRQQVAWKEKLNQITLSVKKNPILILNPRDRSA